MSKYHAGKHGSPLCGTRGTANRYNVICVDAKTWNSLPQERRCTKCAEKIKANKNA